MNLFTSFADIPPDMLDSCRYFYARGALWGVVITSMFFVFVVPWIRKKLEERHRKFCREYDRERQLWQL